MSHLLLLGSLTTLTGCSPNPAAYDAQPDLAFDEAGDVIAGEFVIFEDLGSDDAAALGIEQLDWNDDIGAGLYLADDDGVSVTDLDRALGQTGRSSGLVEANRPRTSQAVNDPYYRYQWNMKALDVETAWTYARGAGVRVAIVDTGLSTAGEDDPVHVAAGYDFVQNDATPLDANGHGTHVAGTIAQSTNNGKGCVGIAPDAEIMPVRVLDANGSGDAYAIANGITWAADHGAKVINMSLGSAYGTNVEKSAIDYAVGKGVIIVAASGNEGRTSVSYPAAYDGVIAVGASRQDSNVANYSNGGSALDLVAPGGDMSKDQDNDGYADGILQETLGGYQFFEGTSMAAPHVTGVVALLLSAGARPQDVLGLLESTAKDVGSSGWDSRSGYGVVNPVGALRAIGGNTTVPDPGTGNGGNNGGADTTAPVMTGVGGTRSGTSLTVFWTTDEPATSHISFQGYGTYGDDNLVTAHSLKFTINTSKTYRFTVISQDASGNESQDGVWVTAP